PTAVRRLCRLSAMPKRNGTAPADGAATFDYTAVDAASVGAATDAAVSTAEEFVAAAAASAGVAGQPSFESTMRPLDDAVAAIGVGYGRGAFMGYVHMASEVRDRANAAEERLAKWRVELPFREDLYRALKAFSESD